MDDATNDDSYLNTFIDMMRASMPDKVISNFVFVAELVSDNNNELSIVTSNAMTPWLAHGMLRAAGEMLASGIDSFIDEHEDDDQ